MAIPIGSPTSLSDAYSLRWIAVSANHPAELLPQIDPILSEPNKQTFSLPSWPVDRALEPLSPLPSASGQIGHRRTSEVSFRHERDSEWKEPESFGKFKSNLARRKSMKELP